MNETRWTRIARAPEGDPPASSPTAEAPPPAADPPAAPPTVADPATLAPKKTHPTWIDQLKPETRDKYAERLSKHEKLTDYVETMIGVEDRSSRALIMPDPENPNPDEVRAFFQKLGVPDKASDYELEGIEDEGFQGVFREQARGLALSKAQARGVYAFVSELKKAGDEGLAAQVRAAAEGFDKTLLDSVKGDATKHSELKTRYQRGLTTHFGSETLVRKLAETGILYDPTFVQAIAGLDKAAGDPGFIDGRSGVGKPAAVGAMGDAYSDSWKQYAGGQK